MSVMGGNSETVPSLALSSSWLLSPLREHKTRPFILVGPKKNGRLAVRELT